MILLIIFGIEVCAHKGSTFETFHVRPEVVGKFQQNQTQQSCCLCDEDLSTSKSKSQKGWNAISRLVVRPLWWRSWESWGLSREWQAHQCSVCSNSNSVPGLLLRGEHWTKSLSVYQWIHLTFTFAHVLWVVTEIIRSWMQRLKWISLAWLSLTPLRGLEEQMLFLHI